MKSKKEMLKSTIPAPLWSVLRGLNRFRYNLNKKLITKYGSDSVYLKYLFKSKIGYKLNLKNPQTFNEKLNWLKLNCRISDYTVMADKYAVKSFVSSRIGDEYVVPLLGVWNSFNDIDFDSLPNQFVLKCSHDSGGVVICKDKSTLDKDSAKKKIDSCMKRNFYKQSREWPYKNIKPRIIADAYLDDHTGNELRDYKFWCFNGKPKYMYCTIKGENIYENFYDMDFNIVGINHGFPRFTPEFTKPDNFELMKNLAEKLSEGIPFVRVDFFNVEGRVYFGEFTFYDWGGVRPFEDGWDEKLGKLIELPSKKVRR